MTTQLTDGKKKGQTIFEHSSISSNVKMHFENLR